MSGVDGRRARWERLRGAGVAGLLGALALAIAASAAPARGGFDPASVTFVSSARGWVLGTVPCGRRRCVALRATTDAGHSWFARPLPAALTAAADRAYPGSASQYAVTALNVRFADSRDGWIYGGVPQKRVQSGVAFYGLRAVLWATHDGGARWVAQPLHGLGSEDVIFDVEAARGTAYRMESNARNEVTVERTPVGTDAWTVASTPSLGSPAGGAEQTGSFVFGGGAGWLVEGNDRGTTGSARLVDGRWIAWTPPCANVGHSFAIPAASSASDLVAVCVMGGFASPLSPAAPPGATLGSSWLYTSDDGGQNFVAGRRLGTRDFGDLAASGGPIASPGPGTILLGTIARSGPPSLAASFDGGRRWAVVYRGMPTFLGFTTSKQGVAIIESAGGATTMIMTFDGGHHWAAPDV
jgi:hypothetical protein